MGLSLGKHRKIRNRAYKRCRRIQQEIANAENIRAMELLLDATWMGAYFLKWNDGPGHQSLYFDRLGNPLTPLEAHRDAPPQLPLRNR